VGKAEAMDRKRALSKLREKMRRYNGEELARRYDPGLLPKPRKVPCVSSHEIIRTSNIGTLKEYVVARIARYLSRLPRREIAGNQLSLVMTFPLG
jgi:hypothetical protein